MKLCSIRNFSTNTDRYFPLSLRPFNHSFLSFSFLSFSLLPSPLLYQIHGSTESYYFSLQQRRDPPSTARSPGKPINSCLNLPNNTALNFQQKLCKQNSLSETKSSEEKEPQTLNGWAGTEVAQFTLWPHNTAREILTQAVHRT